MAWTRIDDQFLRNPKIQRAGIYGMALYIAGLIHCNTNMTDGFIDEYLLPGLCGDTFQTPNRKSADKLVELELWHKVEGGYYINDFLEYNRSKKQIEEINKKRAEAGRKGGRPPKQPESKSGNEKGLNGKQNDNQIDNQMESNLLSDCQASENQNLTPNTLSPLYPKDTTTTPPFNPPAGNPAAPRVLVHHQIGYPEFDALFMAYQSETGKAPQFDPGEVELIATMLADDVTPDELRVALREMTAKGFACPRISSARNWIVNNREKKKRKGRQPVKEKPGLAGGYVPSTLSEIVVEG